MKFKMLSSFIAAFFIIFSVSCSNEPKNGSGSLQDSISSQDSNTTGNSKIKRSKTTKKYDIKSGIVHYAIKMEGSKIKQTLYFDDFGTKELTETITETAIKGTKSKMINIHLIKDGFEYDYILENPIVKDSSVKREIRKSKLVGNVSFDMSSNVYNLDDKMKKAVGFKEEGTETVAGFKGTKFSMGMTDSKLTYVTYNKVMLKQVQNKMTLEAEKFEENATIPADKFELPKDYTIK